MSMIRFAQQHRRVARMIPRRLMARLVWRDLERTPGFNEDMRKAEADLAAGRWFRFDTKTGVATPNPDWPEDPQP
jgi:hypothetical protein